MSSEEAVDFATRAEGTVGEPDAVTLLHDEIRRIAHTYNVTGPHGLVSDLVAAERFAFRCLDHPARPSHVHDLYLLAGVACGLLAVTSQDLGRISMSLHYAQTGLLCADRAEHPALRVWVRNMQCSVARWAGWHHDALRYAQLAAGDAASATGTVVFGRAVREARAHAALGDAERAHAALAAAADARERTRPDDIDEFGGFVRFSAASGAFIAAEALSWLPEYARAERAAGEAVAAFESEPGPFGNEANSRVDLALARARLGDADGTREALRPVLDLPAQLRVYAVQANVQRVYDTLSGTRFLGSPVARDTAAEIEAFRLAACPA